MISNKNSQAPEERIPGCLTFIKSMAIKGKEDIGSNKNKDFFVKIF